MIIKNLSRYLICASLLVIGLKSVGRENDTRYSIEIQFNNHRFIPQKVEVHAGMPLTIRVLNSSKERIEFESFKLGRENVVEPGQAIVLQLPALRPGTYDFYDDFHDDVPEGVIVAH
jgi:Cupredoxin-like domain